ncbi:response regulator transcription factor [Pseudoalteromonas sp. OF7H-1]|uniref:response regulator transcription factor n=1 Tax=Pseudoalteromonas sp. OF7H-1 TaxID=2917755 RepID=UPI001EF6F88D|nr:response regulator transcription factor [Pseudoalteromonas sp. OF7H-1]MCG7541157.1 response regulator transcription factor [Pseudoalteromonas sp. OF7H-1]
MSDQYRVLYVEDDPSSAEILRLYLAQADMQVVHFDNAPDAHRALQNLTFQLAILDVMLPGGDGRELLKNAVARNIPTIMVTAKVSETDRLEGFELGADDYVCKPYSPREVISRAKALCKRSYRGQQSAALLFDGLSINLESKSVTVTQQTPVLTAVEFELLLTMAKQPQQVFSRAQLIEQVWGSDAPITDRAVDTHLANLRKKLGDRKAEPKFIATRYGQGYQFIARKVSS